MGEGEVSETESRRYPGELERIGDVLEDLEALNLIRVTEDGNVLLSNLMIGELMADIPTAIAFSFMQNPAKARDIFCGGVSDDTLAMLVSISLASSIAEARVERLNMSIVDASMFSEDYMARLAMFAKAIVLADKNSRGALYTLIRNLAEASARSLCGAHAK